MQIDANNLDDDIVGNFMDIVGLWSEAPTHFDPLKLALKGLPWGAPRKMERMCANMFGFLLILALLASEDYPIVVSKVSSAFVKRCEDDGGLNMDVDNMEMLLKSMTTCRSMNALARTDCAAKLEGIDGIMTMWRHLGN